MTNIIQLLEVLGQRARVGAVSDAELQAAVADLDLDPPLRDALLRRDASAINALLKGRGNVMLLLLPAEPEAPKEGGGEDEKGDEETPREPDEKTDAA